MKHPVFSNCLLAAVALSVVSSSATAPAQGTVLFQNDSRGLVYEWNLTNDPTPVLDVWTRVQIAYAPAGTTYHPWNIGQMTTAWLAQNPGWTVGPMATNFLGVDNAGKFDGGTITLDGVTAGAQAEYIIFAWDGGLTFDDNLNWGTYYGVAGPFTTLTGGNGQPPVPLADSFTGMTIPGTYNVPEPSSFALALVGGALLALKRKRRPRC
jgi:PEP-CTERM motif